MFTLRCTARMLKGFLGKLDRDPPPSETLLGDWYANVVPWGRRDLVLFTAQRTLLPIVLLEAGAGPLPDALAAELERTLGRLGIPEVQVLGELARMTAMIIAPTASRQVLGSMNDFAYMALAHLEDGTPLSEVSAKLAEAPCSPIGMQSPDRATRALFASQLN